MSCIFTILYNFSWLAEDSLCKHVSNDQSNSRIHVMMYVYPSSEMCCKNTFLLSVLFLFMLLGSVGAYSICWCTHKLINMPGLISYVTMVTPTPWSLYPPPSGILVPASSTPETTWHHMNLMNKSVVAQAICSILCRLALLFLNSNQWPGQQIINYYKLTSQSSAPYHIWSVLATLPKPVHTRCNVLL